VPSIRRNALVAELTPNARDEALAGRYFFSRFA